MEVCPVVGQCGCRHFYAVQLAQIVVCLFQHIDQHRRGSCCEPVTAETFLNQCIQYAKRIIDTVRQEFREMISVITFRHFIYCLFVCQLVPGGKGSQLGLKVAFDFYLCHTANRCVSRSHTDIHQLVQITENTQLRELCHSGDKYKT